MEDGFTLVELLIAMVIATIVGMVGYYIFSSSNWSYMLQEDIAEAQQSARIGIDRLAKDIRAAGFGLPDPPFSLGFDNSGDTTDDLFFTAPVAFINSAAGADTITIVGIGSEAATLTGAASGENTSGKSYLCVDDDSKFNGVANYVFNNRRHISIGGVTYRELAAAAGTACGGGKQLTLSTALDRDYDDGTSIYIIQAVTYSVTTTPTGCSATNPCLGSEDLTELRGNGVRLLTENIEDIQFAYATDITPLDGVIDDADASGAYDDPDFLDAPADTSGIIAVRANVVARTRDQDPRGSAGFTLSALEDRPQGAVQDGFRRRVLSKIVRIRNPKTGL